MPTQQEEPHHRLTRLALPFNSSRPLHPIAISFVGAVRTMWLPLMASALSTNYPADADKFFTISLSDPTQFASAHHARESVSHALRRLQPVHVHVLQKLTCENETARVELKCCDAAAIAKAQARGAKLNKVTPFTLENHAHGALSYFHVRQGFRDVAAYEALRKQTYSWIVRTRPDLLPLQPLTSSMLQGLPRKVTMGMKVHNQLADWIFAVPRELARWLFEVRRRGQSRTAVIRHG